MAILDLVPSGTPPDPDLTSASPALLRRRALAVVIDVLICYFIVETVPLAALIGLASEWVATHTGLVFVVSLVALVPTYLTYTFFFEWRYARTPGKVRMELLVVTRDGRFPGVAASAVRNLLRYADWLPIGFLLGWALARRSPTGRRLGDRLAGTMVVRPDEPAAVDYPTERSFETATEDRGDTDNG
jgi:uncharacterized RDD family membrane protein YckC